MCTQYTEFVDYNTPVKLKIPQIEYILVTWSEGVK